MADIEYTLVQINLKPRTYAKLEEIKERLHAENRAEAVKKSLYITDLISRIIKKGGRVILEESDGTRSKLVLPEL